MIRDYFVLTRLKKWIAGILFGYFFAFWIFYFIAGLSIPEFLDLLFYYFAFPVYFLSYPFMGILDFLGFVEGEWIVFPSVFGYFLVIIFYYAVFYLLVSFVAYFRDRFFRSG